MIIQTKIALVLFACIIIGAAIVASRTPVQIPMPKNGSLVNRLQSVGITDMPGIAATGTLATQVHRSSLPVLADHMPPFVGITKWWNTPDGTPLTPEKLKGKVVLIDFWTYSCINCIRTYPFIKSMHEKYAEKGLVIVGVHTPEFAFEAKQTNVEAEIVKNGFKHPIALDPDYATWNAYENRYWPAEYFFDRMGVCGTLMSVKYAERKRDSRAAAEASGALGTIEDGIITPDFQKSKRRRRILPHARR